MHSDFFFQLPTYFIAPAVCFLIFIFNWFGYRSKKYMLNKYPGQAPQNVGAVEGSMLGVMSLLLGFTFSVAFSKFEERRRLTIEEANNITTAILRCDMYPDSVRIPLLADFKEYVESRIAYYAVGDDEVRITQEIKKAKEIYRRIWNRAASQSQDRDNIVRSGQMIPGLNMMINNVTTRDAYRISRIPQYILWILLVLVITAAFVLGTDYKGTRRNGILVFSYAIVMTLTLSLITELNRPRRGFITLDNVEQKMIDLRELVK